MSFKNVKWFVVLALLLSMVLVACGGDAQQQVEEAAQELQPTLEAAAEDAQAVIDEVAPTVEAVAEEVQDAVEEAMEEEPTEEPMEEEMAEPTEEPMEADGNMVGAAGTLDDYDLQVLTRALSIDHDAQKSLANLLEESKFHSTYFEGENNGVFIIEFGQEIVVSLAVIVGHQVKSGMVWLYSKRTAAIIDDILRTVPKPKSLPNLQQQ